jgi:hypothetical protein
VTRVLDFFPDHRWGNPLVTMLFSRLGDVGRPSAPEADGPFTEP